MFSSFADTVWQFVAFLVRSYSYRDDDDDDDDDRKSDRKMLVTSNM